MEEWRHDPECFPQKSRFGPWLLFAFGAEFLQLSDGLLVTLLMSHMDMAGSQVKVAVLLLSPSSNLCSKADSCSFHNCTSARCSMMRSPLPLAPVYHRNVPKLTRQQEPERPARRSWA